MIHVSVLLWLGVTTLYIGFGAVFGVVAKRAVSNPSTNAIALTVLHALCLFIPASIFVLWMPESSSWIQIPVFLAGLASVYLGFTQPEAIPHRFWKRTFALRYFGTAMIFATLWGLSVLLADEVFPILPITLATCFASTVSFLNAPRIP